MGGLSRGWYQDPDDPELARWHDGHEMTGHTLVIADQPQGRVPDPPDEQDLWSVDEQDSWSFSEQISWSPDDIPLPSESLHTPRHRAHSSERQPLSGLGGMLPDVRWSKLAMPLGIVALVVAAAVGLQLRDDGGDRVDLTASGTDSSSQTDGDSSDASVTSGFGDRGPAVSLPTSTTVVTVPSTTTTAPSASSSTTTTKAPRKTPVKPPATAPTSTTTTAAPSASTTTTTAAPSVTAGEPCANVGATAITGSGDSVTCAPACGGVSTDPVWRAPDC